MKTTSALLALLAAISVSCSSGSDGGGGDETQVAGLSGPEGVSIVEPDESDVSTGGNGASAPGGSTLPPDADYVTDGASIRVYDPAMGDMDQGNQILCMLSMTAYGDLVNEDPYVAQVDEGLCQDGQEQSSGSGQSSAVDQNLLFFTVEADRLANDAAQVNRFWVPIEDGVLIHALMDVTEAPTDENPFGRFVMNYAGVPDGGTVADAQMIGMLADDGMPDPGFYFLEKFGDVDMNQSPGNQAGETRVHVSMASDLSSGAARIEKIERYNDGSGDSGPITSSVRVAFNDTHLKRQIDGGAVTTVSRTDYTNRVYRYNLYHADGDDIGNRVQLNSGFGIRTEEGAYGWMGYWGLWTPDGAGLEDGDTVYQDNYGEGEDTPYTVAVAPGRMVEFRKYDLPLTELAGQVFEWWDAGSNYRVDYVAPNFRRIAVWNGSSEEWEDLGSPTVIDVVDAGGYLAMWAPTLGGPLSYVAGESLVTYFGEKFINSGDPFVTGGGAAVELFGYVDCLKAEITASEAETGDVFHQPAVDTASPYVYRYDTSDLTLRYDPLGDGSLLSVVGLADGEMPMSGPFDWGMRSGPLVTDTAGLTDVWDIWNVDLFYVYETGPNDWNRHVELLDAMGAPVSFDRPIEFLYTHNTGDDMNGDATYDGQKFLLSYQGPGNLHGIPYDPVDLNDDTFPDRWYPRFSLADGTLLGPNGDEYLLRAVEVEQTMNEDPGGAPTLDLGAADALDLPSASDYVAPSIGNQPAVSGPPRVVDGVVVE